MFEVGDRVYVEDSTALISEVRGQYGIIRGTRGRAYYVELDNGAVPLYYSSSSSQLYYSFQRRTSQLPFYTFDPKFLTIVEREISWEV